MAHSLSSKSERHTALHVAASRRKLMQYAAAGIGGALLLPPGMRSASARQDTITRGGTLTIGTAQQITTLDPHEQGLRNNRNAPRPMRRMNDRSICSALQASPSTLSPSRSGGTRL